jgi:PGF-CTERM protein
VHVNQVFQGAVDSIAQIEGLWLIDYANAMTIESDDEFGDLNDVSINGATLKISNEDTFTLTRDDDVEIGQGMLFKVADTAASELRYYPFVEKTIDGEVVDDDEDDDNVTEPEDNDTEVEEPTEEVTEPTEEATEPTEEATEPTEEPTEAEGSTPGFGVVLGLVGLLAVVYLVRRNN